MQHSAHSQTCLLKDLCAAIHEPQIISGPVCSVSDNGVGSYSHYITYNGKKEKHPEDNGASLKSVLETASDKTQGRSSRSSFSLLRVTFDSLFKRHTL